MSCFFFIPHFIPLVLLVETVRYLKCSDWKRQKRLSRRVRH